jgi:hypothetical protein
MQKIAKNRAHPGNPILGRSDSYFLGSVTVFGYFNETRTRSGKNYSPWCSGHSALEAGRSVWWIGIDIDLSFLASY